MRRRCSCEAPTPAHRRSRPSATSPPDIEALIASAEHMRLDAHGDRLLVHLTGRLHTVRRRDRRQAASASAGHHARCAGLASRRVRRCPGPPPVRPVTCFSMSAGCWCRSGHTAPTSPRPVGACVKALAPSMAWRVNFGLRARGASPVSGVLSVEHPDQAAPRRRHDRGLEVALGQTLGELRGWRVWPDGAGPGLHHALGGRLMADLV